MYLCSRFIGLSSCKYWLHIRSSDASVVSTIKPTNKTFCTAMIILLKILLVVTLKKLNGNFVLLGSYAASSGNFVPTFRDNLSVQFQGSKNHAIAACFPRFCTTQHFMTWKYEYWHVHQWHIIHTVKFCQLSSQQNGLHVEMQDRHASTHAYTCGARWS